MYYSQHHTRATMTEYYSHYLFNTFFTKKINISSFGDLLLMLDQLPDQLKPIMGIYLFKAANHYCNSYNYYLQQMSPKAFSYQYHAKGGVRSVSCECADCRANGRGPAPSDGPTIEEIPNDDDKVDAACEKPQLAAAKKTEDNFDHISSTFSKDLKAAAEAHAKYEKELQEQQSSMQNGVGGDEKKNNKKKKQSSKSSASTTNTSLLYEPVSQSNNHEESIRNLYSSFEQEANYKVVNGTILYKDISEPVKATKTASSSSSSSNEDKFANPAPKILQPQSNGSFTAAAKSSESVVGGVSSTPEWSAKNPRTSPILSASTAPNTSNKPTITPKPVSAVSSGTAGSNSSFKIFDDSTFSSFFSDLKLPNGSAKSSLFDFSPSASATSSKATSAASTASSAAAAVEQKKNDVDDDEDRKREREDNDALFALLKTDMKSDKDPPVYPEIDISADMASAASRKSKKKDEDQMYSSNSRKSLKQEKKDQYESKQRDNDYGNCNNGYGPYQSTNYVGDGILSKKYDRFEDPFADAYDDEFEQEESSVLEPSVAKKTVDAVVVVNYESGCVFCPTLSHLSKDCTHYRDSYARMDRAEVLNRCMKCLVLGHKKENCPNVDKLKCSVCYLPHIALMYHCGNNVSFCKK